MKWLQRARISLFTSLILLAAGCGGNGTPATSNLSGLPTLGELEAMIQSSVAPDTDGDYIPDDIELFTLHTNEKDRDTDHDGLPDNYEIFGDGIFDPAAYVPDRDLDGIIAPRDKDDDGDLVNDGLSIDTDGDGVANYLEFYGYTYDWLTGRFVSCEDIDCTGRTIYKTDPLQRSTDQDPYPDGMEVSGLQMDVSVTDPGTHPLVPAGPSLVADLVAYSVTLNENITYGRGGSLSRGTTWTRETTRTHSQTTEHSWDIGVTVGVGFEGDNITGKAEVTTSYGAKWSNTNETSNSVSRGDSIVNEANWSEARSVNPTEAAHVKLMLKVRNVGAACMSNVLPTLTLRVAGLNVATFEPGNAAITMLPPNGVYPVDDGVYWVVDSNAQGDPIALTMNELRAFESGAPLSVAVTQVKADVLRLGEGDSWERVGDAAEFGTRCDASCADLFLDMGDGNTVHTRVYCGDGPSEPVVTLGDALAWCAHGYEDKDGLWITFVDPDGVPQQISLEDWRFVFDRETMIRNGMDPDDLANTIPADFRLSQMVLHPDSTVFGKAPRDPQLPKPAIHFAYLNYDERRARVCATDYQGVEEVLISVTVDHGDGSVPILYEWLMDEYTSDSNLYTHTFSDSEWAVLEEVLDRQMDPTAGAQDLFKVVVRSINGEAAERPFGLVPPNPRAVAPIIDFVRLDVTDGSLYARVRPDDNYPDSWNDTYPVVWVKAFHPGFGATGGVIAMGAPPNAYQDYHGWICDIPTPWYSVTPIKVVAYVAPGVYAERFVTPSDVTAAYSQGNAEFHVQHYHSVLGIDDKVWTWRWLDLDDKDARPGGTRSMHDYWFEGAGVTYAPSEGMAYSGSGWQSWWNPAPWTADFYARYSRVSGNSGWRMYFNVPFAKVVPAGSFDDIDSGWAEAQIPVDVDTTGQSFAVDDVFLIRTYRNRIAKVQITKVSTWGKSNWWYYFGSDYGKEGKFSFRYVVFDSTAAFIVADTEVYYDKDSVGIELDGSGSKGTVWTWQIKSGTPGATIQNADQQVATLLPADKSVGGYEQTYEVELVIDSGQKPEERATVQIDVYHPHAIIGTPDKTEFDPGDVLRVSLPGGSSVTARTYAWALVSTPALSQDASIEDAGLKTATLKPDVSGSYVVELTINKGDADEDKVQKIIDVTIN